MFLIAPWPNSANRHWRTIQGRAILSRQAREYRERAIKAIVEQMDSYATGFPLPGFPLPCVRLSVFLMLHPPRVDRRGRAIPASRRRDIDNPLKPLLDVLVHAGVIMDDADIDNISIQRGPACGHGRVELVIRPWHAGDGDYVQGEITRAKEWSK